MTQDPNPIVISKSENANDSLQAVARDGAQVLINQLLVCLPMEQERLRAEANCLDYMPGILQCKGRCPSDASSASHITTAIQASVRISRINCQASHVSRLTPPDPNPKNPRDGNSSPARRASANTAVSPAPRSPRKSAARNSSTTKRAANGCRAGATRAPTKPARMTGWWRSRIRSGSRKPRARMCALPADWSARRR